MTIQPTRWGYDNGVNKIYRDKQGSRVYYTIKEEIGWGVFSSVRRLQPDRPGLKDKAIKITKVETFENEKTFLALIGENFPGIVKMPKGFINNSMIIMSKYDCSLDNYKGLLSAKWKCSAIDQLLMGLKRLHEMGLTHRDIRADNIFCKISRGICHLGDFGCSEKEIYQEWDIHNLGSVIEKYLSGPDLPLWHKELISLMLKKTPLPTVLAFYNEQTHQDNLCFFK